MMTLNSRKTVYKIGLRIPFLSLISFLYVCSLIICFLFISTTISRDAFAGEKAWLGIQVQPMTLKASRMYLRLIGSGRGVLVSEVTKGSPAEQMGIKQDNIILSVNYNDIKDPNEFTDAVSALNPGDKIVLLIFHGSQTLLTIEGTMGQPLGSAKTEQITTPLKETTPVSTDMPAKIFAPIGQMAISKVAFSPDGRYALSRSRDGIIKFWDINTGEGVKTFSADIVSASGVAMDSPRTGRIGIISEAFSPDRRYTLQADRDNTIKLLDVATGKEIRTFTGHKGWINSVTFSHDGKSFISGGMDGTTRLWDISTGKELAQFISFKDGEWIVLTPEGYYNSSANGDKHLHVRIGNMVYGVDQYREKFFRPEVVMAALAGKPITGLASLGLVKPAPSVSIVETPASVSSDEATVKVKVADAGGGIGDVRLYLNGSAVILDRTRNLAVAAVPGQAQVFSYKVRLVSGKNSVRAVAFNAGNSMQSTDALHEIEASIAAKNPSLHAIIIGIQDYENSKLTLKYPVADAQLMAATLRERAPGLFEGVNVVELTTKAQTTKDVITKTLKEMSGKVSPDDLFVFFVASHGTVDDGEYFLITSNVGSVSTAGLKQNALSQDDLKAMIANVPATKKLVIIDTCNAGKLGEAIQVAMLTRGMNEETALKILSRAVGSTILSASSSVQEALEGYEGHGLFTYVVAEGLKGQADFNKDGSVNTLELATFVDDQVPALAEQVFKHKQYPMVSPTGQGFPVVMVK